MISKYIYSILFFFAITFFYGQTFSIGGKIFDETKAPAVGSSIILLTKDSSFVKGTVTDVNGVFKLESIRQNDYIIKIAALGYITTYMKIQLSGQSSINIGDIYLKQNVTNLKEVKVEAQMALATQNGDTTSFNSKAYKVNKDATSEDLVTKMPGITVTDGKVQVQGEEVKRVLVDGKPFFGDDVNAVLKNLPAEIVDKVQVFDRKSDQSQFTGFDDGNALKTINITTKPQFKNGVFGKFYGGYGLEDKYKFGVTTNIFKGAKRLTILTQSNNINEQNFSSEDLVGVVSSSSGWQGGGRGMRGGGGQGGPPQNNTENFLVGSQNGINSASLFALNYADKFGAKTDISGSYFFNLTKNNSQSILLQQYVLGTNQGLSYHEYNSSKSDNYNHRINLKIETKFDSMNSVIIQPKLSFQTNNGIKFLSGENIKNSEKLNLSTNNSSSNLFGYNISSLILYRHTFIKKGRTFSLNTTPSLSKNKSDNDLYTFNRFYLDTLINQSFLDQESNNLKNGFSLNSNLSYTEPLNKNNFLLLNYTSYLTDNYSSKYTYNLNSVTNKYSDLDSSLTNVFRNQYQSHASSFGYRYQQEKLNFSINMAYQWAELIKYQEIPNNPTLSKSFQSVLPSAFLQYKFTAKKNFRLYYRSNNNAPSIEQLQDVINNSNSLQLTIGNAALKQDFQQNLNMRYSSVNTEKATSFFTLLGGNYSNNYIGNSTIIANKDTVVYNSVFLKRGSQLTRPVNIDGYYSIRSFINYSFPIKLIKTNLSINLSGNYSNVPGLINMKINKAKTTTGTIGLVFSSNINEKIDFSVSSNSSYGYIKNTLQSSANSTYFSQASKFKMTLNPWKGLVIQGEYSNTLYSGLSSAYNQSFSLLNTALGYKFLENKQAEIKLMVYDLLNQNTNITRTNTESYIQDSETNVLNRYYMVTFTYNFKKYFPKKEASTN